MVRIGCGAAALAVGLLAVAASDAQQKAPGRFAAAPSAADFDAAWPAPARAADVFGTAAMACRATAEGALEACRTVRDFPPNHGFGAALQALAPKYRLAQPTAGESVVVAAEWAKADTNADWVKRPRPEDILSVYPREAMRRGEGGRATISCVATVQGALSDCVVLEESPAGKSFGLAALALTPQFTMRPARFGGKPVLSEVRIPITFKTYGRADVSGETRGVASAVMVWAQAPNWSEVAAAYPKKAMAAKAGGRAVLGCEFTQAGALIACQVASEEPKGQGFGAAAKTLSKSFRAFTETADGKGVKGLAIQLPVTFDPAMIGGATPVVGQPRWAGLPAAEEMRGAFGALKLDGVLRATLSCVVAGGGYMSECKVASENPAGKGVGAAALSLTPKFRMTTWTAEGLPTVGGAVQIPLRYQP